MTQVKAYVPGLYARAAEGDQESGLQEFMSVQRESGMDYLSDGLLAWPGPGSPLAKRLEGVESRQGGSGYGVATTEEAHEPLGEPYFRAPELPRGRWISTLPSPLALSSSTGVPAQRASGSVLSPQLRWLSENGCAFAVLQETEMPDEPDLDALGEAIEELRSPLPLVLRLPPGDASGVIPGLLELPVEALGVDMVSTDATALPGPFPKTLLAGVVDASSSQQELSRIAARHAGLLDRLADEADLHLAPNGDLRTLSPEEAAHKVRALGDAARILRGG